MRNIAIENRRHRIKELVLKGFRLDEIAEQLKVSIATINRDLAILRERSRKKVLVKKTLIEDILAQIHDSQELIKKTAWDEIGKKEGKAKAMFLNIVSNIDMNVAKLYKIIGTVHIDQVNIQNIQNNIVSLQFAVEKILDLVPEDKRLRAIEILKKIDWKENK